MKWLESVYHAHTETAGEGGRGSCRHNYPLLGADTRLETNFACVGKAEVKEIRSSQEDEGNLVMKTQPQMRFDCTFTITWHQNKKIIWDIIDRKPTLVANLQQLQKCWFFCTPQADCDVVWHSYAALAFFFFFLHLLDKIWSTIYISP